MRPTAARALLRRRPLLTVAISGLLVGAALGGVPRYIRARGWAPLVELAGEGRPRVAVERLDAALATLDTVLGGLDVEPRTQEFFTTLKEGLGGLDLAGLHGELPEQDGPWRRVRVRGQRTGRYYRVHLAPTRMLCAVDPAGPLGDELGDLALQLRLQPIVRADGPSSYLAHAEVGLGLGPVGWPQVTAGLQEAGRLALSGEPRSPSYPADSRARPWSTTCARVAERNPGLRAEELVVVATLWEAFPRLSETLDGLGRVEDLVVTDPHGDPAACQQLRLAARLEPERVRARYPELADYLLALGPLVHADVRWLDERGRPVARMVLDTKELRVTLEAFVRDGLLLPVEDGRPLLDQPVRAGPAARFTVEATVRSTVNGMETEVRGIRLDCGYRPLADGAELEAAFTRPPQVSLSGRAFGIVPTWAVDVLIPGNIDELTREFLSVACQGDEGRGVTAGLRVRRAAEVDGPGVVEGWARGEALDNFLVRLGFQIASQKLLPSEEVAAEIHAVLVALHAAVRDDLAGYRPLAVD